jgi:hypothetical protein
VDGLLALVTDKLAYHIANTTGEYIMLGLYLGIFTSFELYFNYQFKKKLLKRVEALEDKVEDKVDRLLKLLKEKGEKETLATIKKDYSKAVDKVDKILDSYLKE